MAQSVVNVNPLCRNLRGEIMGKWHGLERIKLKHEPIMWTSPVSWFLV